jgi:hypothetical protein
MDIEIHRGSFSRSVDQVIGIVRTFSVEISSKKHVRQIILSDQYPDGVLLEGSIGRLREITLIENSVLEVRGTSGVMRIDLERNELSKALTKTNNRRTKRKNDDTKEI